MNRNSRLKYFIAPIVGLVATHTLVTFGHTLSPINTSTASESILPRNVVVSLSIVNQFFPEISHRSWCARR